MARVVRHVPVVIPQLLTALVTAGPPPFLAPVSEVIVTPGWYSARIHRGDWEPAEAFVLAFSSHWSRALTRMATELARESTVFVLVGPEDSAETVARWWRTDGLERVQLVWMRLDSPWVRDYGPLQVYTSQGPLWLDAGYDTTRPDDDDVPGILATLLGAQVEVLPIDFDGGGIASSGDGLCAMTLETRGEVERELLEGAKFEDLLETLGCSATAIVPGFTRERTGHVDMLVQFVNRDTAIVASLDRRRWPEDAARLDESAKALTRAATELQKQLHIVRVPMEIGEDRVHLSYVNGLRLRHSFLMPEYSESSRRVADAAHRALKAAMPGVRIIPIPADQIIELDGAVHCATLGLSGVTNALPTAPQRALHVAPDTRRDRRLEDLVEILEDRERSDEKAWRHRLGRKLASLEILVEYEDQNLEALVEDHTAPLQAEVDWIDEQRARLVAALGELRSRAGTAEANLLTLDALDVVGRVRSLRERESDLLSWAFVY